MADGQALFGGLDERPSGATPLVLHDLLIQAQSGQLHVKWDKESTRSIRREIRRANQRTYAAIIGASLFVGAAIILGLDGYAPTMVGQAPLLTWLLAGFGLVLLVASWPNERDD
ncbi:MAG: ubiquinone biosynthesis protein [Halothiobacillaceae bacterium]|nr:MAG: ubiquinone biosynthesis protein [Halothiobacillaceae bacterium]